MRRTWALWLAFSGCLAVLLAAMGWISLAALRLDEAEAKARGLAALEENVRLALWRMDSALAPILAEENARPYFAYSTFLPMHRAYEQMFNRGSAGEALVPSPLLSNVSPYIVVHFQFEPDGSLTSPRAPAANNYKLAVPERIAPETVEKAQSDLGRIGKLTDRQRLAQLLPQRVPPATEVVISPPNNYFNIDQQQAAEQQELPQGLASYRQNDRALQQRGSVEFQRRSQMMQNTVNVAQIQAANSMFEPPASTDLSGVPMQAIWIDGELLLARRVVVRGQEYLQGCLLDWPALRRELLASVADLLPEADLVSMPGGAPNGDCRMLAALPAQLLAGSLAVEEGSPPSPIRLTLLAAWVSVLLAAAAVASLLWGVIRLSERRAAFVSAVTHELRTPLTTFHMYTEMLSEGMVPDAEQRQRYLETLRVEASRLTHLVENVLAYARLERGRTSGRTETIAVGRLLENIEPRLADRARQAGMELAVAADDGACEATVRANPSAVEQVLFNLVDNACKYAASADDKRIHLSAHRTDGVVRIAVRDHGPGIARTASRRLFRPFSKSAHEAANSAPGVGLGLALSRRLARDMGGQLCRDETSSEGAAFELRLPSAD